MTDDKARKVAEETVSKWTLSDVFNDFDRQNNVEQPAENKLADLITQALLQFAQEQESEAVRELVAALEPFAVYAKKIPLELGDGVSYAHAWPEGLTFGHFRRASALIAKHSGKGASQ